MRKLAAVLLGVLAGGVLDAQSLECRIGLLDGAVGRSDGVTFVLKVLDTNKEPLATLLQRERTRSGWLFVRRDLGRFAGKDVWLQLEVGTGKAMNPNWDWAVWHKPVVRDSNGIVILDVIRQLAECEAGYVIRGPGDDCGWRAAMQPGWRKPRTHRLGRHELSAVA